MRDEVQIKNIYICVMKCKTKIFIYVCWSVKQKYLYMCDEVQNKNIYICVMKRKTKIFIYVWW